MPAITLANFVVYVVQISALAVIGVALPRALGVAAPRARLFHYRIVLVVAICLPLAWSIVSPNTSGPDLGHRFQGQRSHAVGLPGFSPGAGSLFPLAVPLDNASTASDLGRSAGPVILGAIAAGLVARLVWVAAGFRRLGRLRRRAARLAPRPLPIREAVVLAAADADIRLSVEIGCPVNFGARHPTILLPRAVRAYPHEEQRAITCHELIHVRRRDWLRTIGDEIVRATFWFHPGIWWLLDEIHLAREQIVDQEVVELTRSRRPYLEALVKLARPAPPCALRPASLFLRRAHLARRVALLLKEVRMSKARLLGALVTSTSTVLIAGVVAAWALPLQAAPAPERVKDVTSFKTPVAQAGAPVTPKQEPRTEAEKRLPRQTAKLLKRVAPMYPPDAKAKGIKGNVIVEARIDPAGHVTDVKVLRSVPGLDQAALDAVRQWRFAARQTESVYVATVRFDPERESLAKPKTVKTVELRRQTPPRIVSRVEPVYPPEAKARGVKGNVVLEIRVDADGKVTDVKVLRSVDAALDQAAVDAVRQWRYAPLTPATPVIATVTVRFHLN